MEQSIIPSFGTLYRTFVNYANDYLKDTDLSFPESVILSNIAMKPGISQEEISVKLSIDRAAIARNVKHLTESGYINAEKNAADKRAKNLTLTSKGLSMVSFISRKNSERISFLFEGIETKNTHIFMEVLEQLEKKAL